MHRILCAAVLAATFALAACSSGKEQADAIKDADTAVPTATPQPTGPGKTPPTSTPAPTATPLPASVKVLESGVTSYTDSGGAIVGAWAAVIQNVDTGHQATDTQVTAIIYGADNVVLETDQQTVTLMLPGMVSAAGSQYISLTARPARVEVRIAGTKFVDPPSSPIDFVAVDVVFVPDRFSSSINAKIANPASKDISNLEVVCMLVAADGSYPAIGTSFVELLPAGATTVATCRLDSRMPAPAGATPRMFPAFTFITKVAP